MKVTLTINDGITPKLRELLARADGPKKTRVLEAMGMAAKFWAVEAFTDASKRPASWPAKRDGQQSTLQKSGVLRRSLRVEATDKSVTIGTDRKYALIHQLGGEIKPKTAKALKFQSGGKWFTVKKVNIPARPYLPVRSSGLLMPEAREHIGDAALGELTEGL